MEKKSDTYQIATDIQWEYAGDGIVRQIMAGSSSGMSIPFFHNDALVLSLPNAAARPSHTLYHDRLAKLFHIIQFFLPTTCELLQVSVWR